MENAIAANLKNMGYEDRFFTFTQNILSADVSKTTEKIVKDNVYTLEQVAQHNTESDAWIVIEDVVYDVTKYVDEHPGGLLIMDGVGKDATELFKYEFPHTEYAETVLAQFKIGRLKS
jgi:cytochrome b involved in lipid metabolism